MSLTFEAIDKLERETKDAIEEHKSQLTKIADQQRRLLMGFAALRGALVEDNREATE